MELIIKLLKLKITKVIIFLIVVAFIASLYFYRHWYKVQVFKCVGYYYVHQGDKAFKRQKYQKAIDNYRTGLKYYPGHSRAGCNLGNIYVSFENYHDAVSAYENALKYSPNYIACRMDLGIILSEKMSDYDKAIQEYGRVINAKPFELYIPFVYNNKKTNKINKGLAYYNMGLAYRGKALYTGERSTYAVKYLKKAKESYKKAEKYLKNDYDNTFNLALTNHLLGDYGSAASEYCRAINIKPDSFDAHYNFALLLRSMNLNKEALDEFEKSTMLINYYENKERYKYVYGIITEIKRRIINSGEYDYLKDHIDVTALSKDDIVYKNGKITADNQKDIDMNAVLKCNYTKRFIETD